MPSSDGVSSPHQDLYTAFMLLYVQNYDDDALEQLDEDLGREVDATPSPPLRCPPAAGRPFHLELDSR